MKTEARTEAPSSLDPGLEGLYREVGELLYRRARARGLNHDDAWDVVQEVMVDLHRTWPKVGAMNPEERKRYASGMLRNAVSDAFKEKVRDNRLDVRLRVEPQPPSEEESEGESDDRYLTGIKAVELLGGLPPGQYQIMCLRQEGLKPRHIAKQLDMPGSTVRSQLQHARRRLTNELQAWKDSRHEG
ncbi:RNA polymerase sigma factor (sigma-70 family) [Actinoplanes lutulentus]|uniref:RNA polymerase sigma factor (Sigma-70 family) n=1 Tax=Actinoplanes lutulentus TaxID=1287878 RepID=A0A327YYE7_9ACTN|nr:sigma-70 family RNA polymerase sigma factor [Actinoplanes lutulentus]MBB2940441.1 RNA polymerase sigma factor (sigma-70 family) [Actinoplanes lutulentus]RAK25827.1 RNA polymerase sigma factor (sigma-70 family) [Actinoplanes lutulentus]